MSEYKFVTIWRIDAPIESIYAAIQDTRAWPRWWKNIESVAPIRQGGENGIGAVARFTFRTELPYKLRFDLELTRNEFPTLIEGNASGELQGLGRWTFAREGGGTVVTYLWHVRTTRWWMNLFAPIARPFFARNHEAVMANGGRALAALLNAQLLQEEYIELDPSTSVAPAQPTTKIVSL